MRKYNCKLARGILAILSTSLLFLSLACQKGGDDGQSNDQAQSALKIGSERENVERTDEETSSDAVSETVATETPAPETPVVSETPTVAETPAVPVAPGILSIPKVHTGVALSLTGDDAPNFKMTQARVLTTTTANGALSLSFTLECGTILDGSSNSTYACDGDLLDTQLDYIFFKDQYNLGPITASQAAAAFSANAPTKVNSLIVSPGGSDLNSNTLANGGFYTSNSSPLVTGTGPANPDGLNNVFILRRKNASGTTLSYLYFYVQIANANGKYVVYGCGTYFAGGLGTSSSPFQVNDRETLANTGKCTTNSTYFAQTANIDLLGSAKPWTPGPLYGHYDGKNFTISNLYISDTSATGVIGLFTDLEYLSSVSNLKLTGVNIKGGFLVGPLAGQSKGVSLKNIDVQGTVESVYGGGTHLSQGGLIGYATGSGSTVSSVTTAVTLKHTPSPSNVVIRIGGFFGFYQYGALTSSSATGLISVSSGSGTTFRYSLGGLIGWGTSITLTNNSSAVDVDFAATAVNELFVGTIAEFTGASSVSGCFSKGAFSVLGGTMSNMNLAGFSPMIQGSSSSPISISNTYVMNTISITGASLSNWSSIGGFAGSLQNGSITNSYSAAPSITSVGMRRVPKGFITNLFSGTISNSYLYKNANVPADTTAGITSYTTPTEMQSQAKFTGFTFGTSPQNWKMPSANPLSPNGLLSPVLFWQCGAKGIVCP